MENKETVSNEEGQTTQQPDTEKEQPTATAENQTDNSAEEQTEESVEAELQEDQDTDKAYRELAELKDKYLRLYADFENFRRRTAKEKLDLISTANEGVLVSLLPVLDDFERAHKSMENATEVEALKEGVQLIFNKLFKTLEAKGLKPMTSKGEAFNADLHESVTQFPAPSEDLKGKVIDELEKGYYLNDKVIRFAKVVIGG
ncbi:nucleotide exchange factor GrpE [Tellurirhabdus bombi]|uniref:nucleotide exchange factor GrpE n=1 Tax=Tellurirhabdus bombi TaxID=2907205 RepID=UPI001F2B1BDD|nr:nucleotide exchange factor GrpE [Tellurirhabdus bombi]